MPNNEQLEILYENYKIEEMYREQQNSFEIEQFILEMSLKC